MLKDTVTLSEPRPRTDVIAQFEAMRAQWAAQHKRVFADGDPLPATCPTCAGAGKVADGTPCADCKGTGEVPAVPDEADTQVTSGVSDLQDAIAKLQKEQKADPDVATDPNDVKVTDLLNQLDALANELAKAQSADDAKEPAPAVPADNPAPTMNPATVKAAAVDTLELASIADPDDQPISPVDELGNVDDDAICATNGCSDPGSMHQDTDTGKNTGACTKPGCNCPQMTFPSNQGNETEGADDAAAGGADEPAGPVTAASKMTALFGPLDVLMPPMPVMVAPPVDPDVPKLAEPDPTLNAAPAVPGDEIMGAPFIIPCGIIEGQATDDGRGLGINSLSWLEPPYALMGQTTSTHDPSGMDTNSPAVLCGRIDEISRVPGEDGTQIIMAKGSFLPDADGDYYAAKVAAMGRIGVSADVKVFDSAIMPGEMDDYGFPLPDAPMREIVTSGEVSAFTIVVPSPAFSQCYIRIDSDEAAAAPIPVQTDEQLPMAASAHTQYVHFYATEACEPCGQMDVVEEAEAIVAGGGFVDAPMRPPLAWFQDPHFTVDDGRLVEIFSGRGATRLGGKYACPLTITDEGEVYAHIAPWDVCHTGYKGRCVTAPHSMMNYNQFMRAGQVLLTAEGEKVRVGPMTFATGHADLSGKLGNHQVVSHYDNTGTVWADVVAGEDEHGIWIHGALRPNVTELMLRQIRAASPSGDWRECEGNLELMAILQVNQPGFPVALIASGETKALVAAGSFTMFRAQHAELDDLDESDHAKQMELIRLATKPMIKLVMSTSLSRLDWLFKEQTEEARQRIDAL